MRTLLRSATMAILATGGPIARADGNVTVYLDRAGNLVVIGDDEDNNITICPGDCDGRGPFGVPDNAYQVWSLDGRFVPDTTVNGLPGYPGVWFIPTGREVRVDMKGGNDRVRFEPTFDLDLVLRGGDGDDILGMTGLQLHGDIRVEGGDGDDIIGAGEGFEVDGDFVVDAGDGDDYLIASIASIGLSGGTMQVKMGPGNDVLWFAEFIDFLGPVFVDLGPGMDRAEIGEGVRFFDQLVLSAGSGNDRASLSGVTLEDALLFMGTESDIVSAFSIHATGRVHMDGGPGKDFLREGASVYLGPPPKFTSFEPLSAALPPLWTGLAEVLIRHGTSTSSR
jgi:hypothetical protein